jgi:hypothetical protein
MTQFDDRVQFQRDLLAAEEWAWGFKSIHIHSLQSCWYDDRPEDTADGTNVTDIQYNNGVIVRSKNGKEIHRFGEAKKGQELVYSYIRNQQR